jgi:hypothetical protein
MRVVEIKEIAKKNGIKTGKLKKAEFSYLSTINVKAF